MIVRSLTPSRMTWSYDMDLQDLFSAREIAGLPFGSVFGSVPPHSVSKRHCHQDGEMFIVLDGPADVVGDGEPIATGRGDVVYLPPFTVHEIRNDTDAPFSLVSVYWEDGAAAGAALEARPAAGDLPGHVLVVCPPPTPNGRLHLGHLAGPYVRADLYVRALRSTGRTARLITGTDDYQSYVEVAARLSGRPAREVAAAEGDGIVSTLRAARVVADRVTRPGSEADHERVVSAFFDRLVDAPGVTPRTTPTAYCAACDVSLFQAFARGGCPACAADSDGEICEACGRPNEARELVGLRCRLCGGPPSSREETALWLDLERYRDGIREYVRGTAGSPDIRALAEELLAPDPGLRPFRLTRTAAWGTPLPERLDPGVAQRVDPWVDLCLTLLAAARSERAAATPDATTLFLGYDNSYFYAVLLPGLALALGVPELLPTAFVTNRFLELDGEKFSTSRGHALWADAALAEFGADDVRASLLREAPEGTGGSLSRQEGERLDRGALPVQARRWISGFGEIVTRLGPHVPGTGAWTAAHREFHRDLLRLGNQVDGLLLPDTFSARAYVRLLEGFVDRAERFRAAETAVRAVAALGEEARTGLALEFLAAQVFAAIAAPVVPGIAAGLWVALGLDGEPVRVAEWAFLPGGHRVSSDGGFERAGTA